ncbi:MAG: CpsB/CapC family capsule biosynthesis tyrosine phosphatase [Bacteroidota bacterium]
MGIFKTLFKSEPKLPPADLSALHTDVHSHLIPGIDDGAKTMDESINMIRELHLLGYKKLITTPHIMCDHQKNTKEGILWGLQKLREAVKKEDIPIDLESAAEYYADFDLEAKIEQNDLLTFGDNYVLFELSFLNLPENLGRIIFKLHTSGYKPVIAHVERYAYWHNNFNAYRQLKDADVLFQLNIPSLAGYYSPQIKKAAERLIDDDMIELLGTDCHSMNYIEFIKSSLTKKSLRKVLSSGKLLNNTL